MKTPHLLLALAATTLMTCAAEPLSKSKPNIFVILTDDVGWGDYQCYNEKGKNPVAQCGPARARRDAVHPRAHAGGALLADALSETPVAEFGNPRLFSEGRCLIFPSRPEISYGCFAGHGCSPRWDDDERSLLSLAVVAWVS